MSEPKTAHNVSIHLFIIISFFLFGCTSNSRRKPIEPISISLEQVQTTEGCLDSAKYFDLLNSMNPELNSNWISTRFEVKSPDSVRTNLKLLLALRTFQFESIRIGQIEEVFPKNQEGCITANLSESPDSDYKVTASEKDFITIRNEEGETHTYRWLTPYSFQIEDSYSTRDFGCGDEPKTQYTLTRIISWADQRPLSNIHSDTLPTIDAQYIEWITQALGHEGGYFDSERVERLSSVQTSRPLEEVLSCR